MNATEQVQHEARQRADRLVEQLAGNIPKLVNILTLLDQKLTSQRLQGTPVEVAASIGLPIVPGIPAQRLIVVAFFLSAGGGSAFNFQQGRGRNLGPLTGLGGGGNIALPANNPNLVVVGSPEAPVMIADVANDIILNNLGAQAIVGHIVWSSIEP